MEVSERDQNKAINRDKWTRSPFGIKLPLSAYLINIRFAQSYNRTVVPWMLRDLLGLVHLSSSRIKNI